MKKIPLDKIKVPLDGGYVIKYFSVITPDNMFISELDKEIFCLRLVEQSLLQDKLRVFSSERPGKYIDDYVYDMLYTLHDKKIYAAFKLLEEGYEHDSQGNMINNYGKLVDFPKMMPKLDKHRNPNYEYESSFIYAPCFVSGRIPMINYNNDGMLKDILYDAYVKTMENRKDLTKRNFLKFFFTYITLKCFELDEIVEIMKLDKYVCIIEYGNSNPYSISSYGLMIGEFVWILGEECWVEYDVLLNKEASVKKVMRISSYLFKQAHENSEVFELAKLAANGGFKKW